MTKVISFLLLGIALVLAAPVAARAPQLLPVQAYLTSADGEPVDGPTKIRFRLYSTSNADAASVVFDETRNVSVDAGHFTVYLGDAAKLDLALFAKHDTLFVGLQIADDPEELTPLLQLATAPYAAHAQSCGDAETLGGKTAEELMSTVQGSAYENLEAEGKLAGDADESLVTRKQGDARYTRMAGCYWMFAACGDGADCRAQCREGDGVVSGGCDGLAGADPAMLVESYPSPSAGYGSNPPAPFFHGASAGDPTQILFDTWTCQVQAGHRLNNVSAFCCPRI